MMTQEEYMDVKALHAAGWTIRQIAEHAGYRPATVSGWLKAGGPRQRRKTPDVEAVVDRRWQERIAALRARNADLQATSIVRVIRPGGFEGSYQSLTRHLRAVRGPTRGKAAVVTVPIETGPGEQFQFDWSDCTLVAAVGLGPRAALLRGGAVLEPHQALVVRTSIDQPPLSRAWSGSSTRWAGWPAVGRTDRMGQLGLSRGRGFVWHPIALELARHYGFALKA